LRINFNEYINNLVQIKSRIAIDFQVLTGLTVRRNAVDALVDFELKVGSIILIAESDSEGSVSFVFDKEDHSDTILGIDQG
jgi:hypothetical protein